MNNDINFDDLVTRFQKRIYGSRKGDIRLAVLWRDLWEELPQIQQNKLNILDIGAGLGQMGLKLATLGHHVCMNDLSANMLNVARQEAEKQSLTQQITWHHGAFQAISDTQKYDVVLAHAVLEWLDQPETLIAKLDALLLNNGMASLMFYNIDALIFHNLIRGNFNKIDNHDFAGMKGGLTPPNPLQPAWVQQTLLKHGFEVVYQSGIRVFSDYVGVPRGGHTDEAAVLAMELRYSKQPPYINMGRYVHYLCRRKA